LDNKLPDDLVPGFLQNPGNVLNILNTMSEMLVLHDNEFRITWANTAACESVHMNQGKIQGHFCFEIWQRRNSPCDNCPMKELLKTGKPQSANVESSQGRIHHIRGYPVFDAQSDITGFWAIKEDVTGNIPSEKFIITKETERDLPQKNQELICVSDKSAGEEELRSRYEERLIPEKDLFESEEKFRTLVEYAIEPIAIVDLQGTVLFVNPATAVLLESNSISELLGRNVIEFVAPESRDVVIQDFIQVSQGVDGFLTEYQVITTKGSRLRIECIGKNITYEGNSADLLSFHDITYQKKVEAELRSQNEILKKAYQDLSLVEDELRAKYNELSIKEKRLQESEERFRVIFSVVPDPIVLTRVTDGAVVDCNQALIDIVGRPYEEIIGKSTFDFCIWKNQEERESFIKGYLTVGSLDKKELLWKKDDGTVHYLIFSSRLIEINGEKVFLNVSFDYTDLKNVELLLKESEEMFRKPVENSPVGVFLIQDGQFVYVNPHLAKMLGYTRDALHKISVESLFLGPDNWDFSDFIATILDTGSPESFAEMKGVRSDGTVLDFEVYASSTKYRNSLATYGTIIDVTERKIIESARDMSDKMYHLITDNMQDVIWILDVETGYFRYISPSAYRLFGYTPEEVINYPFFHTFSDDDVQDAKKLLLTRLEKYRENPFKKEYFVSQYEQRCKDGSTIMTEITYNFFVNDATGKTETLGLVRDISKRRKAEDELERKNQELHQINEDLFANNEKLVALERERRNAFEALALQQQKLTYHEKSFKNAQAIAHLGNWDLNIHEGQIFASEEFFRIFGVSSEHTIPTFEVLFNTIAPPDQDRFARAYEQLYRVGALFKEEFSIILQDASKRHVRVQGNSHFNETGALDKITLTVLDITGQYQLQQELIEAAEEKEVLLREIHHRVKNNMQVISSLISLQSRSIQDSKVKDLFLETQSRVKSLSLVHELLYQSESLNNIQYRKYLQTLSSYIFDLFAVQKRWITCTIPLHNVSLSIEKAVPLSLIVTELITNSLKYAFPEGQKGEIVIDFQYYPETSEYVLHFSDNGRGFSKEVDQYKSSGFGSTLIQGLIRQLSGKIKIDEGKPGVHYVIAFPSAKVES